jgi:diguanylate cyclase (GGDEF)-like protein/PAS domain S-box-containing protein
LSNLTTLFRQAQYKSAKIDVGKVAVGKASRLSRFSRLWRAIPCAAFPFWFRLVRVRVIDKDGRIHWVRTSSNIDVENGKIRAITGLMTDITARKQTEEALLENEARFRSLFEQTHDAVFILDLNGRHITANRRAADMLGYTKDEIMSLSVNETSAEGEQSNNILKRVLTGEHISLYERLFRKKDGRVIPVEINVELIRDKNGGPLHIQSIVRDITERKRMEEALREEENLSKQMVIFTEELIKTDADQVTYQKILENLLHISKAKYGALTLLNDGTGEFTIVAIAGIKDNIKKVSKMFGFELVGKEWHEYSTENEQLAGQVVSHFSSLSELAGRVIPERISKPIEKLLNMGEVAVTKITVNNKMIGDFTLIMPAGKRFENDTFVEMYSRQIDMFIARIKAEEALHESEERYHTVVSNMPVVTFVTDEKGIFILSEGKGLEKLDLRPNQAAGQSVFDVYREYPSVIDAMKNALAGHNQRNEVEVQGIVFDILLSPMFDQHGKVVRVIGVSNEVTERKQAEAELRRAKEALETAHRELQQSFAREQQLARTDALTGVNSRHSLFELAAHEFEVAMRYRLPLSTLMVDIDDFKRINDTFGHAAGDKVLESVIQSMRAQLRDVDLIGRYGGEEFVIILPVTSAQHAYLLAERIRINAAALRVETNMGTATVTLSLGIAETIHTAQDETAETIIHRADEAMYAAKQAGRNRTVIFDSNRTGII